MANTNYLNRHHIVDKRSGTIEELVQQQIDELDLQGKPISELGRRFLTIRAEALAEGLELQTP